MSDLATGAPATSAAPAGGAPATGAPTGAPGAAPAGTGPTVTGIAAAAPAATTGGQAGAEGDKPASWYGDQHRGFVELKGWQSGDDIIASYQNLEKLVGAEKLPMPKGEDDKDGWNRTYDALGRPKAPAGYNLPVPPNVDPAFGNYFAEVFHEEGLSSKQAVNITNKWNARLADSIKNANSQFVANSKAEIEGLQKEYGNERYNALAADAQLAAQTFGLDKATVTKLEHALGTRGMTEFLAKVGAGLGEDALLGGDSGDRAFRSLESAQARLDQLKRDKSFTNRYLSGESDARREMDELTAFIAGEQDAREGDVPQTQARQRRG